MTTSRTHDSAYVYLNATEVSRFAYSFSGVSRANLYIGARNDSINSFRFPVQGIIDDVQVWERPLSRNEILQYMFTPQAGKEQGLVLYYPFNEGWGDFTKNAVDNYLDGVLYWAPQWISLANKPKTWAELMTSVKGYYPESDNTLMLGCHPNPSGKFTCINFNLPERGRVLLQLFDIHGMLLKTLLDSELPNGNQEYRLNDPSLPKGTYFVKLAFSNSKASKVQSIKIIHSGL